MTNAKHRTPKEYIAILRSIDSDAARSLLPRVEDFVRRLKEENFFDDGLDILMAEVAAKIEVRTAKLKARTKETEDLHSEIRAAIEGCHHAALEGAF